MGLKKGHFRAIGGKEANKFYMFKNERRRNQFIAIDKFMKFARAIAFLALIASVVLFAGGIVVWIMSFVFVIGFTVSLEENLGIKMVGAGLKILPYALIVAAVLYIASYIVEWLFILRESAELNKDKESNAKYIEISKKIKKVKLIGMICIIAIVALLSYVANSLNFSNMIAGEKLDLDNMTIFCVAAAIIILIINKIYSTRQLLKIQPLVTQVIEERAQIRADRKEQFKLEKKNRKEAKRAKKSPNNSDYDNSI